MHCDQLVFTEGLYLSLELLEHGGGGSQARLALADRLAFSLLLTGEAGAALQQGSLARLGCFKGQHLLLQAAVVVPLAQVLIGAGLGAVALKFLAGAEQLLLDD